MSVGCLVIRSAAGEVLRAERVIRPTLEEYLPKEMAEAIHLPELEWQTMSIKRLINRITAIHRDLFIKDQMSAPVHGPLLDSLAKDGMLNPLLLQHQWFPMIGNQRLRCAVALGEKFCEENEVTVARIAYPIWDCIGAWPNRQVQTAFLEIYFECLSHVFKSRYYAHDVDSTGRQLSSYEQRKESEELNIQPNPLADWVSNSSPA